jgi:hypothetical protein
VLIVGLGCTASNAGEDKSEVGAARTDPLYVIQFASKGLKARVEQVIQNRFSYYPIWPRSVIRLSVRITESSATSFGKIATSDLSLVASVAGVPITWSQRSANSKMLVVIYRNDGNRGATMNELAAGEPAYTSNSSVFSNTVSDCEIHVSYNNSGITNAIIAVNANIGTILVRHCLIRGAFVAFGFDPDYGDSTNNVPDLDVTTSLCVVQRLYEMDRMALRINRFTNAILGRLYNRGCRG